MARRLHVGAVPVANSLGPVVLTRVRFHVVLKRPSRGFHLLVSVLGTSAHSLKFQVGARGPSEHHNYFGV